MLLATLLVKPDPPAADLHEIICDVHLNDGADTGKALDHDADQSAIAQTKEIGLAGAFLGRLSNRDAVTAVPEPSVIWEIQSHLNTRSIARLKVLLVSASLKLFKGS